MVKKIDKRSKEWREAKRIAHRKDIFIDVSSPEYKEYFERETLKHYKLIISESNELELENDTNTLQELETPSQGLGDTLEKVFKATGIKKVVDWLANGKDCGCDDRRKKLNKVFSYKAKCLEQKEYDYIKEYNKRHDAKNFTKQDVKTLSVIHNRVFSVRIPICSNCPSGVRNMNQIVTNLNKMIDLYDN